MIGDGKTSYDDANDNVRTMAGHGCQATLRNSEDDLRARVTYFKNKILKLEFTDSTHKDWQTCFILNNIVLPDSGHIGFSAKTGEAVDNHDIIRVTT